MCIRIVKTYEKTFIKTLKSNFAKNQVQWTHSCLITLFQWRFESVSHHSSDKTGDILHTARFRGISGMFLITKYLNHGHKTKIYFWGRGFISWLWIKRPRGSEFDINVILNLTGWLKTGKKTGLNKTKNCFTGFPPYAEKNGSWNPEVVNCSHLNGTWICFICPGERYLMSRSRG